MVARLANQPQALGDPGTEIDVTDVRQPLLQHRDLVGRQRLGTGAVEEPASPLQRGCVAVGVQAEARDKAHQHVRLPGGRSLGGQVLAGQEPVGEPRAFVERLRFDRRQIDGSQVRDCWGGQREGHGAPPAMSATGA